MVGEKISLSGTFAILETPPFPPGGGGGSREVVTYEFPWRFCHLFIFLGVREASSKTIKRVSIVGMLILNLWPTDKLYSLSDQKNRFKSPSILLKSKSEGSETFIFQIEIDDLPTSSLKQLIFSQVVDFKQRTAVLETVL